MHAKQCTVKPCELASIQGVRLTNEDLFAEQVAVLVEELLGRAPAGDRRLVGVHDHDRQVGDRVEVVLVPARMLIVSCSGGGRCWQLIWCMGRVCGGSMFASTANSALS